MSLRDMGGGLVALPALLSFGVALLSLCDPARQLLLAKIPPRLDG
jgi:hypothetical protein